jgi:cell division protein FtsB
MDYNRLLKENDSLANTNEALKKRIAQLEAEIFHLKDILGNNLTMTERFINE